ncbi:MAG: AAA family ATPase [Myxococcota bacterium]
MGGQGLSIAQSRKVIELGERRAAGRKKSPRALFQCLAGQEVIDDEHVFPHLLAPRGGLGLLVGMQDLGKSILTTSIGAQLTKGEDPFDGLTGGTEGPGSVLFIANEDGDPRGRFLKRWRSYKGDDQRMGYFHRLLSLPKDGPRLDEGIREFEESKLQKADLVIVDPVLAYAAGDSDKASDVRRALDALQDVAAQRKVSMLCVHHPRKGAATRTTGELLEEAAGSAHWANVARTVLFLMRNPADRAERWLALAKVKTLPEDQKATLTFRLEDRAGLPHIAWGPRLEQPLEEIRRELAEEAAAPPRDVGRQRAAGYLAGVFDLKGELRRSDLDRAQSLFGVSDRTRSRAMKDARIRHSGTDSEGSRWELDLEALKQTSGECL